MLKGYTQRLNPAQKFWEWFAANNTRFINLAETNDEKLLDELTSRLHLFNPKLFFLLGGGTDEVNELIITADGNELFFDSVIDLVLAFPKMEKWKVTAFKPALGFDHSIQYQSYEVNPADVWFRPIAESNDFSVDLEIGVEDFDMGDPTLIKNAIHLFLDVGLGERSNNKDINVKNIGQLPDDPFEDGYQMIEDLPNFIELFKSQFN